jgi:hypothetical protein
MGMRIANELTWRIPMSMRNEVAIADNNVHCERGVFSDKHARHERDVDANNGDNGKRVAHCDKHV